MHHPSLRSYSDHRALCSNRKNVVSPPNDQQPAMMMIGFRNSILQVVYREPRLDTGPKSVSLFDKTNTKFDLKKKLKR